jgi:hypothetical protein
MPPANRTIEFEGYFAEGVLGIFKIIRGFADLRDLAAISAPYELSDGAEPGQVIGHQRRLNEKHARDIRIYLFERRNRSFLCRQGPTALPRIGLRHQTRPGCLAAN